MDVHARDFPQRTVFSLWDETGELREEVGFGALYAASLGLSSKLTASGLAGKPVLLLYPPGLDFIVALLACMASGALAVPLPVGAFGLWPPAGDRQDEAFAPPAKIVADMRDDLWPLGLGAGRVTSDDP